MQVFSVAQANEEMEVEAKLEKVRLVLV